MIALIDANNFFVSCERAFNPKLVNKPVVVASGNGGCVVARSNEAKAIGIPMGAPVFKYQSLIQKHNVHVLSGNMDLYQDLSKRMMKIIQEYFPLCEVYSVDEAFIDLKKTDDVFYHLTQLKEMIQKGLGIPTTIGLGLTKSLAKIANYEAKKKGIPLLALTPTNTDEILKNIQIEEVWGVGQNTTLALKMRGIYTADDLKNADPRWIRKTFSVVLERIVHDLNGLRCLDINMLDNPQKSLQHSRSFATPLTNRDELYQTFSQFIEVLCQKLRSKNLKAKGLTLYARSSPFLKPLYFESKTITFKTPTDDSIEMMKNVATMIDAIFKETILFKKVGVMAHDIFFDFKPQPTLFQEYTFDRSALMKSIDQINQKFGKKCVQLLSSTITPHKQPLPENKSPQYTTNWEELLTVH